MTKKKAVFCWSGGKDSAYCLHKVLSENVYDVKYLFTTINKTYRRISMHGVKEELLEQQARSIGIPLLKIYVQDGTNSEYESLMKKTLLHLKEEGINDVIFGDIFLEDLRKYRENNLSNIDMKAAFPIWKMNTDSIIKDFILKGFKTITCCIDDGYLDNSCVGKIINKDFLKHLPPKVDPCGENGEFHTFCFNGPIFNYEIKFKTGEKVFKPLETEPSNDDYKPNSRIKGFWYIDLIPA